MDEEIFPIYRVKQTGVYSNRLWFSWGYNKMIKRIFLFARWVVQLDHGRKPWPYVDLYVC